MSFGITIGLLLDRNSDVIFDIQVLIIKRLLPPRVKISSSNLFWFGDVWFAAVNWLDELVWFGAVEIGRAGREPVLAGG